MAARHRDSRTGPFFAPRPARPTPHEGASRDGARAQSCGSALTYNERLGGYEVPNLTPDKLKGAPKFSTYEEWNWSDRNRKRDVMDYWGP
jgi:hypothetical protein